MFLGFSCASVAQTARISFLEPEVKKPIREETAEFTFKLTQLFGSNWVGPGLSLGFNLPIGAGKIANTLQLGGQIAGYYQSSTYALDPSVSARVMLPIGLSEGSGFLGVYVQFLAGPTVYFNSPANWGYHFAILPGVRYLFNNHWGVFSELGYSFHALISGSPVSRTIHGGSVSVGVAYEF